jgi:hypothetical protein
MGKFNQPNIIEKEIENHPDRTVNKENGVAFNPTAKTDLTLRVLTWLVNEPKFYDNSTENTEIKNLVASIAAEDPEFILQLALYARKEMYLRSAPIFLLVEASAHQTCKPYLKQYTKSIISRVDELTETLALFIQRNGQIGSRGKASIPNSLKEGLADAFHSFNEYQYGKYDQNGIVKLKDVLRLVHPKPKDEKESELFKKIRDRTLATPETWETQISGKGSTKEAWVTILPKMGYMAVLRNLRNFLKVGLDVAPVSAILTNPEQVAKSKQFPYRFLSAYKVLETESEGDAFARQKLMEAVSVALELSTANLPHWKGRTFVSSDNSGSMDSPLTDKSKMTRKEVGNVMAALAYRNSDSAIASVFGTYFKTVPLNPRNTVISNAQTLINTDVDCSTNAYLCMQYLIEHKVNVDRILIFSDMQCYDSQATEGFYSMFSGYRGVSRPPQLSYGNTLAAMLKHYKRTVNPNVYLYSFDLAGYGTLQFPQDEPNVCLISGFSERIFDFIKTYEETGQDLISKIKQVKP